ncbi:MAG: hypothetical protein AAGK17_07075 [Pseudomonadota bacterium]
MPSLFTLAAPAALLVPAFGLGSAPVAEVNTTSELLQDQSGPSGASLPKGQQTGSPLSEFLKYRTWRQTQTRIEQRVIIRISPQRVSNGNEMLNRLPRQSLNARYVERKTDKCLAVDGIAGVQTGSGNRLLLFLRDKKIITVNLEKACRARDFYSGFYVEKNKDGKLCVNRDRLHSRTGVKCEVQRMRQLVAVTE